MMFTSEKVNRKVSRFGFIAIMAILAIAFASTLTSAGPIEDIPEAFAGALGMEETYIAEMILSMFVLASLGLALAAAKSPAGISIILMIVCMGTLTVMGWLDVWVLVMVALLTVALFGRAIVSGQDAMQRGGD